MSKLVLKNVGDKKLEVLKLVRDYTGLGLKEAKDLVDTLPRVIPLNTVGAYEFADSLRRLGAQIEVQEDVPSWVYGE